MSAWVFQGLRSELLLLSMQPRGGHIKTISDERDTVSFDNCPYCQICFKEGKREGSRTETAHQTPHLFAYELQFFVGLPEEQLNLPVLTTKLLIFDIIFSLQFLLLTLAKVKHSSKKDRIMWLHKLRTLRSGTLTSHSQVHHWHTAHKHNSRRFPKCRGSP